MVIESIRATVNQDEFGMAMQHTNDDDKTECIVCKGNGYISKREIIRALGGADFLRMFELTQEQFFTKLNTDVPNLFRDIKEQYDRLSINKENMLKSGYELERKHLMEELAQLKVERDTEKQIRTSLELKQKVVPSLIGQNGEMDFREWAAQFSHFEISEKLSQSGDYVVQLKRILANGNLELIDGNAVLVDVKRSNKITVDDVNKIWRDMRTRGLRFGYILVESKDQFRNEDHKNRVVEENGSWLFKGDRESFLDDISLLRYFIDVVCKDGGPSDKEQKEKLQGLILQKLKELDHLKNIGATISREADKISTAVDNIRQTAITEINRIISPDSASQEVV